MRCRAVPGGTAIAVAGAHVSGQRWPRAADRDRRSVTTQEIAGVRAHVVDRAGVAGLDLVIAGMSDRIPCQFLKVALIIAVRIDVSIGHWRNDGDFDRMCVAPWPATTRVTGSYVIAITTIGPATPCLAAAGTLVDRGPAATVLVLL